MILFKPEVVKKFENLNATWRLSRSASEVFVEVIDKTTMQPYHKVSCPPGDEHVNDAADKAIDEAFNKPKPLTHAQAISQAPLQNRITELEAELAAVKAAKEERKADAARIAELEASSKERQARIDSALAAAEREGRRFRHAADH